MTKRLSLKMETLYFCFYLNGHHVQLFLCYSFTRSDPVLFEWMWEKRLLLIFHAILKLSDSRIYFRMMCSHCFLHSYRSTYIHVPDSVVSTHIITCDYVAQAL